MAKKKKKIFKQKIREMLTQAETKEGFKVDKKKTEQELIKSAQPQAVITKPEFEASTHTTLTTRSDLKKIAIVFLSMAIILAAVYFISNNTTWLAVLADKIYNWAQLGS